MDSWKLSYCEWRQERAGHQEALCTLGNGYMAVRGTGPEARSDSIHYPGVYLAGGYNKLETEVEGHVVINEDLVNWPNWLPLSFKIENGQWFELGRVNVLEFRKEISMEDGHLRRFILFEDSEKRKTRLEERRIVSMDHKHVGAVEWKLTPINWEGNVTVKSSLDGSVRNEGVKRYKSLNSQHLEVRKMGVAQENIIYLEVQTNQSEVVMAQTAKVDVYSGSSYCSHGRITFKKDRLIGQEVEFYCSKLKTYTIEKICTFYTSRDHAISSVLLAATKLARRLPRFSQLFEVHKLKWKELWYQFDLSMTCMPAENMALRLHVFHLLQTACHNTIGIDTSVPARGLHGEAYRGHIFWDELFIFPFFYLRMPELSRSLLMYRYRRLEEAKHLASEQGFEGAMFPWQSGSDGSEEGQSLHLNPKSGNWVADNTSLQRHINGAIVYNIVKYYEATDDHEFMHYYGIEMIFEICKFWVSAAKLSSSSKRYELCQIVGPDEFHTKYPGSDCPGLHNNAYTNFLASWSLKKALSFFQAQSETKQDELLEELELTHDDLSLWAKVASNLLIPFQKDGIISQFSGYEELEDFPFNKYINKYGNIQRLDRILEAEGDDINKYKVNKQADVLMMFYLFSTEELKEQFEYMGYKFDPGWIPKNIHYYLEQTTNGSSLSRVAHSWVLARLDRAKSWKLFQEALASDLMDTQEGTTSEGIHLGAMAGTVDIVQRCFIGMEIRRDVLWFNPLLPKELGVLIFRIRYRGHMLKIKVDHQCLWVEVERSWITNGKIGFKEQVYEFRQGDSFEFGLCAQRENLH